MSAQRVSGYRFKVSDLSPASRQPGISIFMRVRNGADFLKAAILSHAGSVDEIVVVYNQCTDASPTILEELEAHLQGKLRVFHYTDKVYPPGSAGHARTAANDPSSFVNMSNFALAQTSRTIAMKLDDDHLAMGDRFNRLADEVRARGCRLDDSWCFSGINLAVGRDGDVGVPASEPLVGAGDHFLFEVTTKTSFHHDRRFEDFRHSGRRTFKALTYWHLKYLKADMGFANRALDGETNPRFERKKQRLMADRTLWNLAELRSHAPPPSLLQRWLPRREKQRLRADRWQAVRGSAPDDAEMRADLTHWNIDLETARGSARS